MPVRTPAEHPLRLHSWRLRFYAAATMFQPSPEAADAHLRGVLADAAGGEGLAEVPELQDLLEAAAPGEGAAGGRLQGLCGSAALLPLLSASRQLGGRLLPAGAVAAPLCSQPCNAQVAAWAQPVPPAGAPA